jgi:type VI protein secretion system component VasK
VRSVTLTIEGQTQTSNGSSPAPMQFAWSGNGQPVMLTARIGSSDFSFDEYSGPWALFRFLNESENWTSAGAASASFERTFRQGARGTPVIVGGSPVTLRFELDAGRVPIFQRGYFTSLRCVPEIARP